MSLNCNEINLILEELDLTSSFIQDIVQPGYDSLALYTYKEGTAKTIFISTAQNSVRINETRRKITKNEKPLRFMEFLKSKIKGCRINSCSQIGFERIIKMDLQRSNVVIKKPNEKTNHIKLASTAMNLSNTASSQSVIKEEILEEKYILYIKLWNNAANVILCNTDNIILETMFRRPEKLEVKDNLFNIPQQSQMSKDELIQKFPIRTWEKDLPNINSFNSFIDYWYSENAQSLSRKSLLEKAEKWYNVNRSKKEASLNNLLQKQISFNNAEQIKHEGDLILSFGHLINKDSNFLDCTDYETGKNVHIRIDPKKSAQENASDYYKNYKKTISGAQDLEHDIENLKNQISKLDEQYKKITEEENPIKIEQLLRKDSTPKQQIKKNHPGLEYLVNGWTIYVGRDANENDDLLRHNVKGQDLWLHVRDYHGGYVFIKAQKNKTVPLNILLDAGNLAVYYSKARTNTKVDLYYTQVKYLRRAKNGPKGLVIPTQEKNLCVSPEKERLRRLENQQIL